MGNPEFAALLAALDRGEAPTLVRRAEADTYTRRFLPPDRLILLGGGHIAQPLCAMAAMLDFSVVVVDDRPSFANAERFPQAAEVICDAFPAAIRTLAIRQTDYVCCITRGHRWDADCLRQILSGPMPWYLGMIGSSRRVSGLLGLLAEEGVDAARLSEIRAPIGLPIGALTPAEIAVSICAQLVARRREPRADSRGILLHQTNTDLEMLRQLAQGDGPRALLLVLSTTGSTPVKSGAMMAVDGAGHSWGTIGGGCSEAAVMTRARRLLGTGESRVVTVDMSNDVAESEGMVCGGTMRVLLEDVPEA